ncbi:mediator of RNA polymerase II transcription subunit 15a-like protein [Rhynchospora pubera]|uniref:Mediator of RNA polymerase II transcription subunit 15a-like protein n=1 Tax=Rhynchospora pubera TaxID=906938 RepID=A0AAV8F217_9POAL|nr:mediator of RNA polymerase II transcription subunit 15a-like protein [Rhynchospora pubera]
MDPNWNAAQGGAANGPGSGAGSDPNGNLDWRSQLQPDARQRIVNKIMDTLKRHLPVPVPDGLSELQKIAVRFEEKIYGAATSQPDYLRKISLKMLSMETKTTQPGLNPALPNQNRIDPGVGMTSQQPGPNPSQSIAMPQSLTQPPVSRQQQQQPLVQGWPNMPSSVGGGPSGATIPPMSGPSMSNSNPMSVTGGTSGPGGLTGPLPTDMYSNNQRRQPPQQLTSQNQILFQQQLAMRKLQQQQQQQQQQSLLQQTQMQMSSALSGGSGMMSAIPTGGMQQPQMNSVQQQPVGQGGSLQQQSLMRQQPQPTMQNPNIPMQQTNNVTELQQQRLQMQQNQMQQSQMQQNQMQQSQMQQNQMQQSQMQQNQLQQNQLQQSQMQQSQMQQNQLQQNQLQQNQLQQNQLQQNQLQQNQLQQNQLQQNQLQQNQMQQNQMLNPQMMLNQQQNQLLGNASTGNMNNTQRQMQMQRQAGMLQQQQPQQQQHLLSQLQSQQQQMPQQQLQPQQQQPSMLQQREMQIPQQRMQGSPALLQMQNSNAIDPQRQQQQQFIPQQQQPLQQQRVLQDVASSPASMDSTAQTGHPGDFQEEMYQRIKYLKDTYFNDLREIHQKLSMKLSQVDSIPMNARSSEQIERMKNFKTVLERMMAVLQLGKQSIHIGLKDKLSLYEKQILNILQNNKKVPQQQSQGGGPDQQHFAPPQQSQPGLQSQQPPQQHQPQQMDNHPNQLQQQLSNSAMPQSSNIGMNATQQGMQNALHSDQLQTSSTGFGSLQQGSMGSTMQNSMNPPQMVGSGTGIGSSNLSHTGTMTGMTPNMNAPQVLKQQQQQQEQQIQPQQRMMPTQQQIQQRHFHQRLMQQKQQQLLQQQLPLQQQVQQQKQLQPQNQMQQLGQPSDPGDLKMRQGAAGMKPGAMYQQHYPGVGPRNSYYHSQVKPGSNLPISSPQNIQSSSPQISHPSPQVDQHGLIPPSQLKSGTPLQAAASPFIPSPSPPVAPSPMIEDTKLGAGLIHNSAAGQAGQPLPASSTQNGQMGQPQAGSLAVGTPGISASPLLAEFTSPEAGQGTNLSTQVPETEKPIEKLARLMRTMPHNQLSAAVKDIASVVSMVDRIAGSAPGNGSRAAIGDDLVAMTKCRLQAKNLVHPDGGAGTSAGTSTPTKKMKRDTSAMPLNSNNNDGFSPDSVSVTDNFKASGPDTSEIQSKSTATSSNMGLKSEMHHALLEEIREINIRLIDTELTLNEEDADSTAEGGESILVKCTYTAVALSPGLRAHFTSSQLSPILPLRLLVPAGYPKCSPVILDKILDEQRDLDDFSTRARAKFNISIRGLTQPMSLKEIAHTWDTCARKVIQEYAAQFGGGSFSSRMIKWQIINPEDPYIIV